MSSTWRVLKHPPQAGAWNMAVDEAIMESVRQGFSPPTLRLYAWEPACLSLGVAQSILDVNQEALHELGYDLVRRPTGGRAILHVDELTYAVIGRDDEELLKGGVLESYQRISRGLLKALNSLGVEAQAISSWHQATPDRSDFANPVCFEAPSDYEITHDGKKVIGSAQLRRKGCVLQHGSLPLYGDLRRILACLTFNDVVLRLGAEERLSRRATTLEQILGKPIPWERAAEAFVIGFQEVLRSTLVSGDLTPFEVKLAEQLVQEKYKNWNWTARV